MKAAVFSLFALAVSAVDVNTDESPYSTQFFQSVFNGQYHSASTKDKVISQMPELYDVAPCQYWYDNSWYNLIGTDGWTSSNSYQSVSKDGDIVYFTMCQLISKVNTTICTGGGADSYAAELPVTHLNQCLPLTTNNLNSVTMMPNGFTLPDGSKTLGVFYNNTGQDLGSGCSLELGLVCDSSMSTDQWSTSVLQRSTTGNNCEYKTTMTSKNSCAVYSLNSLWAWLQEYYYLWGAAFIIVGFFLALFGQKLFSATLFIIGTLVTVCLIWLLFYSTFLSSSTAGWIGWVVLGCSILLGLAGGFLLYKCQRLGASIIGGWGGFLLGVVFTTTVLWAASSEVAFWIISISFALIAAGLAFMFYYHAVILSTSFTGSYFFIRGISLYAGGFPNEWALIEQIKSGAIDHISYWFYLYLFFIIVCFIISTIWQYRHFKKGVEDGDYDANGHPKHPYDAQRDDEGRCC